MQMLPLAQPPEPLARDGIIINSFQREYTKLQAVQLQAMGWLIERPRPCSAGQINPFQPLPRMGGQLSTQPKEKYDTAQRLANAPCLHMPGRRPNRGVQAANSPVRRSNNRQTLACRGRPIRLF